jgi:hypothetical protein
VNANSRIDDDALGLERSLGLFDRFVLDVFDPRRRVDLCMQFGRHQFDQGVEECDALFFGAPFQESQHAIFALAIATNARGRLEDQIAHLGGVLVVR